MFVTTEVSAIMSEGHVSHRQMHFAFTKLSKMKRPSCKSAGIHIFFSLKYHATHHLQKLPQNQ
jgi:hypothetical protein